MPVRQALAPEAQNDEAPHGEIGHNMPPIEEQVASEFREQLLTDRPDFEVRLQAMIDAAERVEVANDETLGKAGDLIKMYRAAEGHINETHKAVKEPYLRGGRAVDAEKNSLINRIQPARDKVQGRMNEYAMRAAALAPAEQVKAEPIRSDAGSTISGRQVWNSQVDDYQVAFIAVEDNPKVREAIDKAVAKLVKAGKRQIEGVRIWPTAQAVAR